MDCSQNCGCSLLCSQLTLCMYEYFLHLSPLAFPSPSILFLHFCLSWSIRVIKSLRYSLSFTAVPQNSLDEKRKTCILFELMHHLFSCTYIERFWVLFFKMHYLCHRDCFPLLQGNEANQHGMHNINYVGCIFVMFSLVHDVVLHQVTP